MLRFCPAAKQQACLVPKSPERSIIPQQMGQFWFFQFFHFWGFSVDRLEEEAADMKGHLETLAIELSRGQENASRQESLLHIQKREMNLKVGSDHSISASIQVSWSLTGMSDWLKAVSRLQRWGCKRTQLFVLSDRSSRLPKRPHHYCKARYVCNSLVSIRLWQLWTANSPFGLFNSVQTSWGASFSFFVAGDDTHPSFDSFLKWRCKGYIGFARDPKQCWHFGIGTPSALNGLYNSDEWSWRLTCIRWCTSCRWRLGRPELIN